MKKHIFKTLSLLLAVSFLTSCLKDDRLVLDPEKGHNVIEFANPAQITTIGSIYPLYTFAYDIIPTATIPVSISYSGPESGAPEDIVVNFAVGTEEEVETYNEDQDLGMVLMPSNLYKVSTNTVTIKKGESKASFNITVTPDQFNYSLSYALPLKISSASSGIISGNFNTILLNIGAKNIYDGSFKFKGRATGAPERTNVYQAGEWIWPGNINLITSGASTVDLYDDTYNFGGGTNQWLLLLGASATTGGGFGQCRPRFTLDPATNKVTAVTNAFPNPTNGRVLTIDPSYDSRFNPADKSFNVRFFFIQPGFANMTVTYNFTYDHAR